MDIKETSQEYRSDIDQMHDWCDEIYKEEFQQHFSEVYVLYTKLKSNSGRSITDAELEWALTTLPLELFTVAEKLNKLRLSSEMVKLKNKDKRAKVADRSEMLDNDILLAAYSSIIAQVENQISFSREFIMGAKKVWDSRRRAESSNPVGEVVPQTQIDLPNYVQKDREYITGA